jgi:hypothetical protein
MSEPMTATKRATEGLAHRLVPRLEDVVFVALFVAVIGLGPRLLNADGDLPRHLTLGGYILDSRSVPTHDLFSYTMLGAPLVIHEWLAEVLFTLIYRALGLDGVVLLSAVVIAMTFALLFRQAVRRSGLHLISLALVLIAAATSSLHWLARPHLLTMLLVVIWTAELERLEQGVRGAWWRLPLLMLVWANVHGAFIAGFVIWMAYGADYLWRRLAPDPAHPLPAGLGRQLAWALVLSVGVSFLNPSGAALWSTTFGLLSSRYIVSHTAETMAPNFQNVSTWPFMLMIVLSLAILGWSRKTPPLRSILLLAGWTVLGLYIVRNVPLYALVAVPILAESAASIGPEASSWARREKRFASLDLGLRGHLWPLVAVLLAGLLFARGITLDFARQGNRFDPGVFPVDAVNWLEAHPPEGQVFSDFSWGGYLLYRSWPERRVFIDSQTDFYGEQLTRRYEQVITMAAGWEETLASYNVGWVLMPARSSLVMRLRADPGWVLVYEDSVAAVVERRH